MIINVGTGRLLNSGKLSGIARWIIGGNWRSGRIVGRVSRTVDTQKLSTVLMLDGELFDIALWNVEGDRERDELCGDAKCTLG